MSFLSQSILGGQSDPIMNPFDQVDPGSTYAAYLGYAANRPQEPTYDPYRNPQVNYADPAPASSGPISGRSSDLLQLDPDPFGTRTAKWAADSGVEIQDGQVMSLDVFGRRMSRDSLMRSDAGSRLVELVERRRKGQKRGFLDAIMDWSWEDAPFVSLFATVGKSVADAVTVSDTFKKLQDGLPVTDDELLKTRLYMAETEERENGTWGATVGDIMRAAPGFMAEFFATGGAYSLARAGLTKAGKEGIHFGLSRATKVLAREAMQEAAERQLAKSAVKGAAGFAKLADDAVRKELVDDVARTVLKSTMKDNPLYKGLADDALERMAKARADYEFSKMLARNSGGKVANGFNTFTQWLGQNVSRGLMDFGAWGTEESTVLFTGRSKATRALADAVGTFLVEAPLKGAMMWVPNQLIARPLIGVALGKDGRAVSSAQLGLEAAAYMTGNRELMANAESMSHGLGLLEYVSENTGRGLSSIMRAAGIGLERLGVHGLVRPAARALGMAEDTMDAVSLGGKVRQWVTSVFGSREGYRQKTTAAKVAAVAGKLGVSGEADMQAVRTAVLSNSTSGLRAELADQVGPDIGKFAVSALKEMDDAERRKLGYKTFGRFMVADWMARHQVGPETVMNMFDRMGYDGVLGEMFEERYSDFAKGLFGWDDRSDHDIVSNLKTAVKNLYPGWDQLTAEAVAFAMPMVVRSGILRVQSAVSGGEGTIRDVRTKLSGINDALRLGTVGAMKPGEYLAEHQRLVEQDEGEIARLEAERVRVQGGIDDAVASAVKEKLAEPKVQASVARSADRAARKAHDHAIETGRSEEQATADADVTREAVAEKVRERISARVGDAERKRLGKPGGAAEGLSQLDADIERAKKVLERRKEVHEKFWASVPESAQQAADEIAVPMYTADDLADDARYNGTPILTATQANEVLSGRNAMVGYAPELGRRLVEMESRLEGEDVGWWRRAAHRIVGVAGALATGDFSLAAANPTQWTARDMGLSRFVVDALKANMKKSVAEAERMLEGDHVDLLDKVSRLRGEAGRLREKGDEAGASDLERRARATETLYGKDRPSGKPAREDILNLAESLSRSSARRIMAASLSALHLRSFTKEQSRDEAMGIVAREAGYEWYADRDDGSLRFFKYGADGKTVDQDSVLDAQAFYDANKESIDDTQRRLVAATADILTRRLTRAGDDSVRLLNAVTLPDESEIRQIVQSREPGQMGPVSSDAVMREAAIYDAAMRMVGAGDLVERVRVDGSVPMAETLDRGSLARVNMTTVDYISRFDKFDDANLDQRAYEALAWSLRLPFDGSEQGLADRNRKLFNVAKLATHFSREDKAFYSKATPIDDEDATRLTPNGNIPLTASLVDGVWIVDDGRDEGGKRKTRVFGTREEMDAELAKDGYSPDTSRLVLTLAKVIESRDMFSMIRELGLAKEYLESLNKGNLHPMLRKGEDGSYIPEDEAQRILRAELAAAEGGEHAPETSREFAAWARVWGEGGYMREGERLLRANGVEKSVVAKYAGEFSDYAPPVYTLKLSAGRISPASANVYVPVDPLVNPDIESGVVNGLLIHSFMSHPRLLRDAVGGTFSEFAAQVNQIIDRHVAATKDKELKTALERFRRFAVSDVDRPVATDNGVVVRKGAGITASSFAVLASSFVLGRESDYAANPHLRAVADIASDVRMCPAFADFSNVVDLVLGGNGPIGAAAGIAAGEKADASAQRGLQRVMSYASSDPEAMARKLKEMRPLGLDPVKFLDLCSRRLAAMAKSGAPAVPAKEMDELKTQAEAATSPRTPKDHFTFYWHLIAVVKHVLEETAGISVDPAVRDFIADVAADAENEPGVTEKQKDALRKMLGELTRLKVVAAAKAKYAKAFDETLDTYERRQHLKKIIKSIQGEIKRAEARGEAQSDPVLWEHRQRELADMKALRKRLWEAYAKAKKVAEDARNEVHASDRAGNSDRVTAWMDRTLNKIEEDLRGKDGAPEADARQIDGGVDRRIDDGLDAEDEDEAVILQDAAEIPESAALGEDRIVMSHGFTEEPVEMERSVQRLCVNVCVRAVAMRASASADPDADPLETVVTEDSVVAMAKELFHLTDREANALRFQYRLADDLRMRSSQTWESIARSGTRWEFQEDDKADDDVSSDNFMDRAAAEYNSPFLADALALAARVAPESGTNLRAFIARTKEWLRRSGETMVTPGVTTEVGGVPIVWEQSSDGHVSAAWYDPKDGTIHVHAEGIRGKYASGAWKSPERSSTIPGADSLIRSADDLVAWAVYHELGHARDKTPRVATEASRIAREDRANAFASRHLARAKRQAAIGFAMSLLDPRLDKRGKTQAEQSALHMQALAVFDDRPETVAAHVASMLAPDGDGGFPTSRRLAFLFSYMAALPMEDRRNFALLCANSVSAQATHVVEKFVDGNRVRIVEERRVGAGDKVSDRVVGDTFVHVLEGREASEAKSLADALRKAQADVLEQFPNSRYPGKVAGQAIGRVFGRESPLVTALVSDAASRFRARRAKRDDAAGKAQKKLNQTLLESVTPTKEGKIPIVESIAATLEALAAKGEPLTSANVTAAFVALFETGRPDVDVGIRRLKNGPTITDPLKAWISSYADSLPATIMSAEVDQRRDSSGSSVPIAPRDSVPMVSRWIYSDEKAKGVIDGKVVEFPTFKELAREIARQMVEEDVVLSRLPQKQKDKWIDSRVALATQDACWPDGTPVCAKNTSTSLTTRELFLACENAYDGHVGDAWYIPLYAGDHSSSTMLRIPWSVKMDGFMKAAQAPADRTDLARVSFPEGNSHKGKDEKKFNQLGGLTKFIGFGTGSTGLYAKALAAIANKETYTKDDIVGVSVNGKRPGRVPVRGTDVERLVRAAAQAGATIIADEEKNRTDYNLGERELAELLRELGYSDTNGNGVWRPTAQSTSAQLNDVPATDDPGRFADAAESLATIESEKTILSNEELAYWNDKGVGPFPRILTASEHTDPAFHVKEILDIINGKTTVKDRNGKDTGLTGHDFAGLYLVTKHDGLPMKELLESKIPKLIHFSVTTLGGTKYEPGVMKYGDLLDRIAEYLKMGLDPAAVTVRIDPIVPGVTKPSDIREVIRRCAEMGIKRVRFSVMDMYAGTAKHMAALGYDFAANGYRKVDSKTGMDLSGRTFHADPARLRGIAEKVKAIADEYGVTLGTCAEPLVVPGISREGCLSPAAVSNMLGTKVVESKSQQRALCGCFGGKTDALAWNSKCASHCVYCYARHDNEAAMRYYDKDGKLLDNVFTRTRGVPPAPVEQASDAFAPLGYREAAKAMSYAVGMNLMYTDTKRSAITSLENQGAGLIGAEVQDDGTVKYGEHRVHIIHNWAFERKGYVFEKTGKNEALLGTTRMYGYGARTMKTLAKDRKSDLLKLHLISTSGHDLFFIKSLSVAVSDNKDDNFLDDSMNRVVEDYARSFRGDDKNSTDTYTDDDSYKIGVGNSKAILVQAADGKRQKLMAWLFSRLRDVCGAPKGASEEDVAKAFKATYGKLTGDKLDELVDDVQIVDLARTDGSEPVPMKLSKLMPGVMVNAVEGLDGPCLDLSYREDGAMAYTVANVSHPSKVSSEPGRTPRNYEMDLIAAATMLGTPDAESGKPFVGEDVVRDAYDLVANWGLVAACVYATKPQRDALAARSESVENLRLDGEHPDGQNIRSEVARAVWAQVRKNANIPVKGVDAALVACGASIDDNDRLLAHTKSPMLRAMMRGAEIFTADEQAFFGKKFRHALCNVNMSAPGFRHAWFLNRRQFDALDASHGSMSDREVAKAVAALFEDAYRKAGDARKAQAGKARKAAEAAMLDAKKKVAKLFVDHHGIPIWSDDPSRSGHGEKYVKQFHLADLFGPDGKFDLTALHIDEDKVRLDSDPEGAPARILLGGTKFGFPRTPSYNAHYETVRAGLPVKEARYVDRNGQARWRVSHDAMVSPDPHTNKILGTDHDGDKSKLYLLHTDAYGLATERTPPAPAGEGVLDGLADNAVVTLADGTKMRARDAYVKELATAQWLERVWVNPETGNEEPVPEGETPEGMYHRVSDRAKLEVSNAFVRTMFEISDSVPTLGMDGKERVSATSTNRIKCLGGIAFRPVSTQPVLTKAAWESIAAQAADPVLGETEITLPDGRKAKLKDTIGDPWLAALVSTSAEDADGARGTIVALARTLHVAFASGQFSDLFGGQPTGMQWLAFVNHFDGLSNATFDDIKEQICGRLGWTKGMMDTVIVELLSSMDHLPTTDGDWSEILGEYAANVKAKKAEYWMLKASSVEEDEFVDKCRGILGVETLSKENLQAAMGVEFDANEKRWKPVQGKAPGIVNDLYNHTTPAGFNYVVESVSRSLGHNSTLGRLAYVWQKDSTITPGSPTLERDILDQAVDIADMARWANKRAQLDEAQKYERAVNYLTADPGDASKFARYGSEEEAVVRGGKSAASVGGITDPAFDKMKIATGMMYRAAGNLATVEASAVLAAYQRDKNLARLAQSYPEAAAYLFVKDALPRWDRMGLTANRQQLPYLMSFFLRQTRIAKNVKGTPLDTGNRLYNAVAAMAAGVATSRDAVGRGLAARVAIESLFSIMYKLMTSSTKFAEGDTLPAYLRAPVDTEFKEKDYGRIGKRLLRIMPGYRANDREAHKRVRDMYDAIVKGEAFAGTRVGNWGDKDADGTECTKFSLSRKSLRAYMIEQLPVEHRQRFREDRSLSIADARKIEPHRADVWDEIEDAANALYAFETYVLGKPDPTKSLAVTPAMMFGQLLPLYSLMTSRCLGAPDPSSPSILALAPPWLYAEISAGEAELSARMPELVNSVVAGNWAPYLENVRKTGTKKKWKGGKWQDVTVKTKDVDKLAEGVAKDIVGQLERTGDVTLPSQVPDAADAAEHRENPDWRTTVDIFSDEAFKAALKAAGPSTARVVPASEPAPGPAPRGAGAYDEKVARVAGALGLAFGSWATVEYAGGKTFTVRGKLRGTMGQGRNVVFTVDMDGKLCETEQQVEALADSEAYGASLAECVDLGLESGKDFLLLPRDVRIALVGKYGVGGATMRHVNWKFDGKGVATLVGAIRLGSSKADTTVFHEYFHGMMRVFDAIGLFSEEDKAALRKTFGEPTKKGQWLNEERAAESFRKWVEGKMDPQAQERQSIFRKIYDALKGILLAIRRGFGYTDDSRMNMELLFGFVAHGVAQASESKIAEIRARAGERAAFARSTGAERSAERMDEAAASLDAAYLAMNDVAVATAVAQIVPPPKAENAKTAVGELAGVSSRAVARSLDSLKPVEMRGGPGFAYDLDAADEYDSVPQEMRARSDQGATELVAILENPGSQAAKVKEAVLGMLELRRKIASAMGRELPGPADATGPERTDVGDSDLDFMAGTADELVRETHDAVQAVTTPMAEANDFYRAASFIHEALERGLQSEGSWQRPLEQIVNRYSGARRSGAGVDEDRDRAVVLHGLRNALDAIDPGASKVLDDERLEKSLAFQAALTMYHGLDAWSHARSGSDAPPIPSAPGSDERSHEASQYDVSAWILASRPLSAASAIRQAIDSTEEAIGRFDEGSPVRAELMRHQDALRKVLDRIDDETGLMDLRRGDLRPVFDEAFAMLREGTKLNGHASDGRLNDIVPNLDRIEEYRAKGMTRALDRLDSFQNTYMVPAVQESLKAALETLWQAAAQTKFYRETDVTPATAEDMEFARQMALRHNAPHATPAEWAATQAIGDSNLTDNRSLVDFYCQPAFIADNVDAWLQSLVRSSFGAKGNIGDMLSAEHREYGALKMRIADLENFYSLLLGTNVEDGGYLLKVEQVRGKWKRVAGEIVRADGEETYLKVDNYRRKPTSVQMSEADLRVVDLYLKSISAYAAGQDRVLTGMDRLWFSTADFDRDLSRETLAAKWNGGHPTEHLTPLEMILVRLDMQFPEDVLGGTVNLRGRIVSTVQSALADVRRRAETDGRPATAAEVNRGVLLALSRAKLVERRADGSFGVVTIPVDDIDSMFRRSDAYRKLTREDLGGRRPEWLERDRIAKDFMDVYRDAVRFARKHPWLTHGDGQHFNGFGTTLPFWRGSGVFMYNVERAERDAAAAVRSAESGAEKAFVDALSAKDVDEPLSKLEFSAYSELLDRVGEAYSVPSPGVRLSDDVKAGRYEDGEELAERTGLVLPRDATKADLAHALYRKALEDVHSAAVSGELTDRYRSAESLVRAYEESRMEKAELFGGSCGLNDQDMYRIHGKLPANAQIGHKVHLAIDALTNAMMSRATLANLLMTSAGDGAPVYYADPAEYAADVSGLPDEFWANVARWWAEWNGLEYDAKLSGVQNAKAIYGKIHETRKANGGKIGEKEYARTYDELSGDGAKDCATVERWLVRGDDGTFDETSAVNAVSGGEAMGYLKQFVQAGRTLGFGGNMTRATLHRALSWSKSMSVAFSLFFPLATKWESPIGAVGATATIMSNMRRTGNFLREHPELARMLQRAAGGRGWITQEFLGFNDIIEMMDSNDPFLAELKAWANALGVTLSTSLVNPMEETKSVMTEDLRWLKERVRDRMGAKAAAKFGRIVETVVTRGGDKAFNYALNATKLAVVAQMCMKLRYEAQRKGKAFDPVRDLRRYGRYVNAEIGGIDPLRYAWATPLNRGIMNTLMFSWQWTRGAWEAGGGAIIEDLLLGGHTMTREEREYMVGRWVRMFGTVMIGVPALMQCAVMAFAKALGGGDDDGDRWATWMNEDKTKWTAFDLTPLLRAIERSDDTRLGGIFRGMNGAGALLGAVAGAVAGNRMAGGGMLGTLAGAATGGAGGALLPEDSVRRFKQGGAAAMGIAGAAAGAILGRMNGGNLFTAGLGGILGAVGGATVPTLVPMYTGEDQANRTSRARRYYMHFGKQGWEFFRWFDDAKGQFFSKLSMPTQRILEGIMGRNLSFLDRPLPWNEMGQFERWLSPTTDGALYNLAQAFLPFSLGGVSRTGDAGVLPVLGPVQMGASQTAIQDRLVKSITAWARNDRAGYRYGGASRTKSAKLLAERVSGILKDAKTNGFDPEDQLNKAYGQVATRLYGELIDLIPDDPKGDFDARAVERAARAINRIGAKKAQVLRSLKTRTEARLKAKGLSWRDLPAEDRARYAQAVQEGVGNPFGTYDY